MSKTLIEQLNYIFVLKEKTAYKFEKNDMVTFLIRSGGFLYVGIPFSKRKVNESFVGMHISTEVLNYEHQSINCLCLIADENIDLEKFLLIAEDFAKDSNRPSIMDNPFEWMDKWRLIFGDTLSKKKVYDVLGELIALKVLYEKDNTFVWEGPKGGTHDLVAENQIVEIKSTVLKKAYNVSINSSYQLSIEKPTRLFLVRLEKKPYCLSMNVLVKQLVELGYSQEELERLLSDQGYKKGCRARDESYDLLGLYSYSISSVNFPVFTLEQLNDSFAPNNNIVGYTIELDLSGVDHEVLYEKE